ncbi:hypothetical protein [Tateyamaria sp. ANG-S1]|uniref:hypothetical protein n=1 Tax=Tateyamaria sp. ANG-S1 TaxID=1577905 RepID=UPI001269D3E1|nr:hypothetical protein [Tateyamaria sp. ANG-S1]
MKRIGMVLWGIVWRLALGALTCLCTITVVFLLPEIFSAQGTQLRVWAVFIAALLGAVFLPLFMTSIWRQKGSPDLARSFSDIAGSDRLAHLEPHTAFWGCLRRLLPKPSQI